MLKWKYLHIRWKVKNRGDVPKAFITCRHNGCTKITNHFLMNYIIFGSLFNVLEVLFCLLFSVCVCDTKKNIHPLCGRISSTYGKDLRFVTFTNRTPSVENSCIITLNRHLLLLLLLLHHHHLFPIMPECCIIW